MKNSLRVLIIVAVALFALAASSNAQTASVTFNAIGSSALFVEVGQVASSSTTTPPIGLGATCVWSTSTSGQVVATDPTTGGTESGSAWIAWNPGTAGNNSTCATEATTVNIYLYLSTDSTVGNRCLFNQCTITLVSPGSTTANLVWGTSGTGIGQEYNSSLPSFITGAFTSGVQINVAGTDIRPEDALFATKRIHAPCGEPYSGQYYGMGYPYATSGTPSTIKSYYSSVTFNVVNFSLPYNKYHVYVVGAVPILVTVNQIDGSTTNGFGNTAIQNISSAVLAEIIDGTLTDTQDILGTADATDESITTLLREPLSGTYNTFEYNIPNTTLNKTSQDVSLNMVNTGQANCASIGGLPLQNPLDMASSQTSSNSSAYRTRAIGTGELLNVLFGKTVSHGNGNTPPTPSVLGYGFWSVGNFKNAYGGSSGYNINARYLSVDGVDPLLPNHAAYAVVSGYTGAGPCASGTCPAGTIPTAADGGLPSVTMTHVADGTYPIWSFLRLVCSDVATINGCTTASNMVSAAQNFVSFGAQTGDAQPNPDFMPGAISNVVRSHFNPPLNGVTCPLVSNGVVAAGVTEQAECGGDVGGVPYTKVSDADYANDYESTPVGQTGNRR
jgi:hypothetical protein